MNGCLAHGLGQWIVLRDGLVVWFYTYRDAAEHRAEPGDEIVYATPTPDSRHHLPFAHRPIDSDWIVGPDTGVVLAAAAASEGRLPWPPRAAA